ncbi:MAG TPA: S-layer homology domain-containing protein, partial [Bacillota bacterium]|nr:S-layer homology domain-containing protein [Bacillota bacterium]
QDEAEQLISLNNNRGMFINLDNPEYDTYEKSIAAIAQYVAAVLTPEPDVTPPALGQITPADGATVSSLASISIPVSDSEEGISEEQSTLTLIGNSRGPITGTVSFAEGSLVFTPADVLKADEYTVTATVYDFAGNFSQLISHFTIRSHSSGGSGSSTPPVAKVTFTDLVNHWSKNDVEIMAAVKLAFGYPDGTFRPDNDITRAEFAAMLYRVFQKAELKQTTDTTINFWDVSSDNWYYDAVMAMAPEGIIKGYGDGRFGPSQLITREEAAAMIARLLGQLKIKAESSQLNFSDSSQVSEWAKEAVGNLLSLDIVRAMPDGSFRPAESSTRAEAVVMLLRMMQKADLI